MLSGIWVWGHFGSWLFQSGAFSVCGLSVCDHSGLWPYGCGHFGVRPLCPVTEMHIPSEKSYFETWYLSWISTKYRYYVIILVHLAESLWCCNIDYENMAKWAAIEITLLWPVSVKPLWREHCWSSNPDPYLLWKILNKCEPPAIA